MGIAYCAASPDEIAEHKGTNCSFVGTEKQAHQRVHEETIDSSQCVSSIWMPGFFLLLMMHAWTRIDRGPGDWEVSSGTGERGQGMRRERNIVRQENDVYSQRVSLDLEWTAFSTLLKR